ncbi:dihydrofolate reductase family protein [Oerskovia sp. M15]
MLCEGGPHLLADLLAADLLDELCVTTTPVLVGPGPGRIMGGLPPFISRARAPGRWPGPPRAPTRGARTWPTCSTRTGPWSPDGHCADNVD